MEIEYTEAQYRETMKGGMRPVTVNMYCPRCIALGITPRIPSADRRKGGLCNWCISMRGEDNRLRLLNGMLTWGPDAA